MLLWMFPVKTLFKILNESSNIEEPTQSELFVTHIINIIIVIKYDIGKYER